MGRRAKRGSTPAGGFQGGGGQLHLAMGGTSQILAVEYGFAAMDGSGVVSGTGCTAEKGVEQEWL